MNKSLNKKYIFFKKIMTPFDIDEKHMEYSFLNKNKNIFKSIFNMQKNMYNTMYKFNFHFYCGYNYYFVICNQYFFEITFVNNSLFLVKYIIIIITNESILNSILFFCKNKIRLIDTIIIKMYWIFFVSFVFLLMFYHNHYY